MTDAVRRGRLIIGLIIGIEGLMAVGTFLLVVAVGRYEALPRLVLKTIVHVSLMCGLWCGVRWIKWLYVLGATLMAGACLYLPVRFPELLPWAIMIPVAIPFLWMGWALLWSPAVNAFFQWQRGEIKPWLDDDVEFILRRPSEPACHV
jgi:hypothetical protein